MLRSNVRRLILQKKRQPHLQVMRYARRFPSRTPISQKEEEIVKVVAANKQYINDLKDQFEKKGMEKIEIKRDLLLLDFLNNSRPGTKTDKRYKNQQKKLNELEESDQKIQSLCYFLLNEIKLEIQQYPNPDTAQISEDIDNVFDSNKSKEMIELEFKRFFSLKSSKNNNLNRYKTFEVLIKILESLKKKNGGVLTLPAEFYVEVFEMAQFVKKEDLKNKIRYVSGCLIYSLKKFEMDYLSESQFIEALILNNDNLFAESLILKRAEKLDQRWWYELMIVNYLDMGEITKSEETVKLIYTKYGKYLDIRIYQLFINKYIESQNFEKLKEWLIKFTDLIVTNGLIKEKQIPGVRITEKEALAYLNSEKPPTNDEYFEVLRLLLSVKEVPIEYPARMINFYITFFPNNIDSIIDLLLEYKHFYNFKIKPILNLIEEKHKGLNIDKYFKIHREITPIESKNLDFLEEIINIETKVFVLKQRIFETQQSLAEKGEVSSNLMYNLLSALLKAKKFEEATNLLSTMEESKKKIENSQGEEKLIIPKASPKHYLPFLRYHGRKEELNELLRIIERYQTYHQLNPIILTQLLNSLSKMRRYDLTLLYINNILSNDIHLGNKDHISANLGSKELYSTMWKIIKDTLIEFSNVKNRDESTTEQIKLLIAEKLPNLRYLFMKMIHEKIIPSSNDYFNIISAFFIVRDRAAVLCSMEYLNNKHNLHLNEKTIRIINKYCLFPNDIGFFKYVENKGQQEKLKKLNIETLTTNSFDPFNPKTKSEEMEDESLFDLRTMEEEIKSQKQDSIKKLVWLNSFRKVYQSLDKKTITPYELQSTHNDFELSFNDFEQLINRMK